MAYTNPPADWNELTAFQRDVLAAVAALEPTETVTSGSQIQDTLETWKNATVEHGRLYPNLGGLTESGLLEVTQYDGRTNEYQLTENGRAELSTGTKRLQTVTVEAI